MSSGPNGIFCRNLWMVTRSTHLAPEVRYRIMRSYESKDVCSVPDSTPSIILPPRAARQLAWKDGDREEAANRGGPIWLSLVLSLCRSLFAHRRRRISS